jgi:hypothetical protein
MHVHESSLNDRQSGSYVGHAGMHPRIRLVMHIDVNIIAFQRILQISDLEGWKRSLPTLGGSVRRGKTSITTCGRWQSHVRQNIWVHEHLTDDVCSEYTVSAVCRPLM